MSLVQPVGSRHLEDPEAVEAICVRRYVRGVREAREALVIAAVANDDIGNLALRRMSERLQQALYLPLLFQQIKSLHLSSN